MQELVEKINSSRASNQEVMDNFQEKLVAKVQFMHIVLLLIIVLSTSMYIVTKYAFHDWPD